MNGYVSKIQVDAVAADENSINFLCVLQSLLVISNYTPTDWMCKKMSVFVSIAGSFSFLCTLLARWVEIIDFFAFAVFYAMSK